VNFHRGGVMDGWMPSLRDQHALATISVRDCTDNRCARPDCLRPLKVLPKLVEPPIDDNVTRSRIEQSRDIEIKIKIDEGVIGRCDVWI
jgi:hypothetical protein